MNETVHVNPRLVAYLQRTGVWDDPPTFTAGEVVEALKAATPRSTGARVVELDAVDRAALRRMAHRLWEEALARPYQLRTRAAMDRALDVKAAKAVLRHLGFEDEAYAPGPQRGQ